MTLKELLLEKKEQVLKSKNEIKEGKIYIERLKADVKIVDVGYDVVIEIAEMEKSKEANKDKKTKLHACVNGMPEFSDKDLLEAYNQVTPERLIEEIFTETEISFIASRILELGGYDGSCVGAVEELKK
ncbi:MAG: phage tail assembly chaperone [Cetobacterium sp.]